MSVDMCHVLQPPTNHWMSQARSPVKGETGPSSPSWAMCGRGWADAGYINHKPQHPQTCCLFCCPATFDLILVGQVRGRFVACVGTQEVLILSFRASVSTDPQQGGWLHHHLLLSAQGFQPLDMAAVDPSLPWLHPQGLASDSCSWGPCWWISLAGGASFMHLLPEVTCILAP